MKHARAGGLGLVVFAANVPRAPTQAAGPRLFFTDTARGRRMRVQRAVVTAVGPVARGAHALRPVECRPTAHGARARWRTWRGCLRGQPATGSIPRRWLRLFFTDTAPGRRLRLRNLKATAFGSFAARPAHASLHEKKRPTALGARVHWRTWRGCLRVFAANAQRAPSHAVGRGSSSPTPRQVSACGFETQ